MQVRARFVLLCGGKPFLDRFADHADHADHAIYPADANYKSIMLLILMFFGFSRTLLNQAFPPHDCLI